MSIGVCLILAGEYPKPILNNPRDRQPEPKRNDFNINFRWNRKNGKGGVVYYR